MAASLSLSEWRQGDRGDSFVCLVSEIFERLVFRTFTRLLDVSRPFRGVRGIVCIDMIAVST